jgi:hypothetical protein
LHTTFVQAGYKLFRNTWKNSFDTVLVLSDILWTDVTLAVVEIPSLNIGCSRDSFRGFARVAPRAQEGCQLIMKGILEGKNEQLDEETGRARSGGVLSTEASFLVQFWECLTLLEPGRSLNPVLLVFCGGFITKSLLIKSLAIGQFFSALWRWRGEGGVKMPTF